ncbi:hypothetical protein [Candidatus Formimonas warabiya]|uniref:Uncharacterized protein n=1 Tax=Formimonas warabiya TaxID=1761012 RepID=A0A3G1KV52_FORW1|nr:hypothetical protein [Candidatus Formimonas warabiya]ATW26322.1 hypothetical protein DCMF_17525 [Candidatus Formimonas warabiya]
MDEVGIHYARSHWAQYESENDWVDFGTEGDFFPYEKMDHPLKIFIKDKRDDQTIEFSVQPHFIKKSYSFFHQPPRI